MTTLEFGGCFRRVIDLRRWDKETVVGWLEDDYHHFGLTLNHDGTTVKELKLAMPRFPWTTCPRAIEPLRELIGKPLIGRCADVGRLIDMRQQCTHLFDLVGLMSSHAFHGRDHHRYHATVRAHPSSHVESHRDCLRATLRLDEVEVTAWDLRALTIMGPAASAGFSIDKGFREWTETLDEITAERALVLRRTVFTATGRVKTSRPGRTAAEAGLPPLCFSFQPGRREVAERTGTRHPYDTAPEKMLVLVETKP